MLDTFLRAIVCVTTGIVLQASNCSSDVGVGVNVDGGDVGVDVNVGVDAGNGGDGSIVPSDSISVRFANNTPWALDVEFHATADALGDVETVLFTDANQITADLGFAGTGLIQADDDDTLFLDCADAAAIGTQGGRFVDPESGDTIGTGEQRVASIDLQYACGDTITFVFQTNGDAFETVMLIE